MSVFFPHPYPLPSTITGYISICVKHAVSSFSSLRLIFLKGPFFLSLSYFQKYTKVFYFPWSTWLFLPSFKDYPLATKDSYPLFPRREVVLMFTLPNTFFPLQWPTDSVFLSPPVVCNFMNLIIIQLILSSNVSFSRHGFNCLRTSSQITIRSAEAQ